MSAAFGVITNIAVPYLINEDAANLGLKTAWVSLSWNKDMLFPVPDN